MSKKLKYSLASLVALLIGNTAIAKNRDSMKMLNSPLFEKLDINNDGKVSKKEIETQRELMVQSMDLKLQYIDRLIGCIKNHERSYLALTVLKQILRKTFENNIG